MKRILFFLLLVSSIAQAQTPQVSYGVATITALKNYYGNANRIYVTASGADYVICSSCTADEVTVFAGAGGKKWQRVIDATRLSSTDATVTKQGNTFNAANSLAKLDGNSKLPLAQLPQIPITQISNTDTQELDLSIYATKTGTETLPNKTLPSPNITSPTGLVKADVGLPNVDNTSDANKPVSTAQAAAISVAQQSSTIRALQALGSSVKGFTVGFNYNLAGAYGNAMYSGEVYITALDIRVPTTLSFAGCVMYTQGVYTASSYNGIGLYSSNGTTLTLLTSTPDDGNIWKAPSGSIIKKAYTTPQTLQPGVYYQVAMYNKSAETTAPQLLLENRGFSAILNTLDFTGGFVNGTINAGSTLPATITISSINKTAYDPKFIMGF